MKSNEVHKILRAALGPWLKSQGFAKRTGATWIKPRGDEFFVLWFQISSYGFDPWAGGKFTMELQISPSERPGAGYNRSTRERLPQLLNDAEIQRAVEIQNTMRLRLQNPPPEALNWTLHPTTAASYLRDMKPVADWSGPRVRNDFWLPYWSEADVQAWAEFILGVLPDVTARLEAAHKEKR